MGFSFGGKAVKKKTEEAEKTIGGFMVNARGPNVASLQIGCKAGGGDRLLPDRERLIKRLRFR